MKSISSSITSQKIRIKIHTNIYAGNNNNNNNDKSNIITKPLIECKSNMLLENLNGESISNIDDTPFFTNMALYENIPRFKSSLNANNYQLIMEFLFNNNTFINALKNNMVEKDNDYTRKNIEFMIRRMFSSKTASTPYTTVELFGLSLTSSIQQTKTTMGQDIPVKYINIDNKIYSIYRTMWINDLWNHPYYYELITKLYKYMEWCNTIGKTLTNVFIIENNNFANTAIINVKNNIEIIMNGSSNNSKKNIYTLLESLSGLVKDQQTYPFITYIIDLIYEMDKDDTIFGSNQNLNKFKPVTNEDGLFRRFLQNYDLLLQTNTTDTTDNINNINTIILEISIKLNEINQTNVTTTTSVITQTKEKERDISGRFKETIHLFDILSPLLLLQTFVKNMSLVNENKDKQKFTVFWNYVKDNPKFVNYTNLFICINKYRTTTIDEINVEKNTKILSNNTYLQKLIDNFSDLNNNTTDVNKTMISLVYTLYKKYATNVHPEFEKRFNSNDLRIMSDNDLQNYLDTGMIRYSDDTNPFMGEIILYMDVSEGKHTSQSLRNVSCSFLDDQIAEKMEMGILKQTPYYKYNIYSVRSPSTVMAIKKGGKLQLHTHKRKRKKQIKKQKTKKQRNKKIK